MNNSVLVKAIYAELRSTAGNEVSAGDLLRLAHIICQAYRADFVTPLEEEPRRNRSNAFHSMPVDEAMDDGGWKVLNFERSRMPLIEDVEPEIVMMINDKLTRYLGREWQRLTPPG